MCSGRGGCPDEISVKFNVPPGAPAGAIFRFQGCGNWVPVEGTHGDGYIRFDLLPHDDFKRSGDDITCSRTLDYKDLILGTQLTVDVFGTDVVIDVPPRSSAGDDITVPGVGFREGALRVSLQMSREIPDTELEMLEKIRKGLDVIIVN